MTKRLKRNEVPVECTWDTKPLVASTEAFYERLKVLEDKVDQFSTCKGNLVPDGKTFYNHFVTLEEMYIEMFSIGTYAHLRQAVDATDTSNQELSMNFRRSMTTVQAKLQFVDSEIVALSETAYEQLFTDEPLLEEYRTYLDEIFSEKKHQLSPETEETLAALGDVMNTAYKTYSLSKATDMQFDDIKNGQGETLPNSFALFEGKYEYSDDPVLRKNAYASFNKTLKQYVNTYATLYGTHVNQEVTMSQLRGYESVTHMLLKPQKVTLEMYHRQIDVIYNELAPHMRKYAKLLKDSLGLETLNFYDLKAPLDTTYNPTADYEEVKNTVIEALSILGDDYVAMLNRAFDERWIDYADNVGKATGAFCASPYAAHPYILMTFQDKMRDAFTLAHELGHAGHFYLANAHQKKFNTRPSSFNIEAPSTMNEMLLGRHLLQKNDDPQLKRWVIMQFLGTYYHNFVTHLLEAAFQRKVYDMAEKGTPLTAQVLCATKLEVIKGFWGDAVDVDDDAGMTWMRQPHYYMGLYPYTYSAGLTASTAVSEMIFEEGQVAVDRWLDMLKTGGKLAPLELLKVAGMDFTTDEPVLKAVNYVGKLIDQLIELSE